MKRGIYRAVLTGLAIAAGADVACAQQQGTLDAVRKRGTLICAVTTGATGFGQPDDKGNWTGFDVDYCRATAAAVLGDPAKVTFRPTTAKERFTVVQSGEADMLARNSTWSLSRDSSLGLVFVATNFYDGQGFMVHKSLGLKSATELSGATVCVITGTTNELNAADFFRTHKIDYKPVVFEKIDDLNTAYDGGRCDAMTGDRSGLSVARFQFKNPDDHMLLPDVISKEPLAPAVRQGDDHWMTIVKWVHFALVNAEELGVTQANADEMRKTATNPDVKRLLGTEGDFGKGLGLDNAWAFNIIKAVGNYGESYERNLGSGSRLKIDRGLNNLWSKGGIQYAPPVR